MDEATKRKEHTGCQELKMKVVLVKGVQLESIIIALFHIVVHGEQNEYWSRFIKIFVDQ